MRGKRKRNGNGGNAEAGKGMGDGERKLKKGSLSCGSGCDDGKRVWGSACDEVSGCGRGACVTRGSGTGSRIYVGAA